MSRYEMTDGDRNTLRTNRLYMLRNVIPSEDLLGYLLEVRVLNDDLMEEIEVEKTRKSKITKLLDVIPRKGPEAFQHFIHALMEDGQSSVARTLDERLVSEWEASRPVEEPRPHVEPIRQHGHRPPPLRVPAPYPRPKPQTPQPHTPLTEVEESPFLNPEIVPVDEKDPNIMKLLSDSKYKDHYRMDRKPRGRALIINNTYFLNHSPRDGAAVDSMNLCSHLDQLHFETVLHDDLTAQDIKNVIYEESQQESHADADCFVLFIMSHGSQGYIYGIDGRRVNIQQDVVTPFDGNHCQYLIDKPKMFFVQACQGESATTGVTPSNDDDDSQVDASPVTVDEQVAEAFRNLRVQDNEGTFPHLASTHEKSDVVLAYSTVPGYRSWRRTDLGSWFIRAIIKVFSAHAHKEHVLELLVKVRKMVSANQTNHTDQSFLQLTRTDETTRKKIYLFPGYWQTNRGSRV